MLKAQEILNILTDSARRKMNPDTMEVLYANLMTLSNGDWTDEYGRKVMGIIQGIRREERNIAIEVQDWISLQDGVMAVPDCYRDLAINAPAHKAAARMCFARLAEQGIIEREGTRSGVYRKIDETIDEQRWWESHGEPLNVRFCLGINVARIYHGNLILIEGAKSQGKTRFGIDFAKRNHNLFPGKRVRYLNVEMGDDEILSRAQAMERDHQWTVAQFREAIEIRRVTMSWHDQVDPEGLNVIDYIVEYDEPYKIASHIFKIHERMTTGIALVIVQRDPMKMYGAGGYAIRNIPRLILSLKPMPGSRNHIITMEDVKSFVTYDNHSPTGYMRQYAMPGLYRFVAMSDWHREGETVETYAEGREHEHNDPDFVSED